jgi:hypothetical protein
MKVFSLSEPDHGWIDLTVGTPSAPCTMRVSNVPNDGLRDLAEALVRLRAGSTRETVRFSLEPAFARWELHRDGDAVRLEVLLPGRIGPECAVTVPLRSLTRRVRSELRRLGPRYEADDGWNRPFPEREVAQLA